jgi:CDP-glycerol glycerophosphotransferase (TagB/SpsB family)
MKPSRRKFMVNVWHGMPVKRLDKSTPVGRWQTDLTIATSAVHAHHLAETWGLRPDQVLVTGLPRNDILLESGTRQERRVWATDDQAPLVLWLPTYRQSVMGHIRTDGRDLGNVFQMPGATHEAVAELATRLGVQMIVKSHPMAPTPGRSDHPNLTVWNEADLTSHGLSLYRLMSVANVLITDYSSVWIDWLLLDRPCIFAAADVSEYLSTRGSYFEPLEHYLPGPLVQDLKGLGNAIETAIESDPYRSKRAEALLLHHEYRDASNSKRVVDAITSFGA